MKPIGESLFFRSFDQPAIPLSCIKVAKYKHFVPDIQIEEVRDVPCRRHRTEGWV